jgi:hypothetical protein
MVYAHLLNKRGVGVRSPVDRLRVVIYSLYKPEALDIAMIDMVLILHDC